MLPQIPRIPNMISVVITHQTDDMQLKTLQLDDIYELQNYYITIITQ